MNHLMVCLLRVWFVTKHTETKIIIDLSQVRFSPMMENYYKIKQG